MSTRVWAVLFLVAVGSMALADGPADNIPANVRRIPKLGIDVPAERRATLEQGLASLASKLALLRTQAAEQKDPRITELLPDIEIYHKAIHDALQYQEIFEAREIDFATQALATGHQRADQLSQGAAPWTTARGLVVRGYKSKIDGSVQPYGLVIPESYSSQGPGKFRCDLWFHGRGETLSELNFLRDRTNNVGQISPEDTIVLHPYGRYCNAFKFAGEIDVLEALDPGWAINLRHCPTIAYSGELDAQKQAADIMERALADEGIELVHIIGPQTKHAIHADSKREIEKRLSSLARIGRPWQDQDLIFTTYTLRYPRMQWLTIEGMEEHWTRAEVAASLLAGEIDLDVAGVTDLSLSFPAGEAPLDVQSPVLLVIGEQELEAQGAKSDRSWSANLHKVRGEWRLGKRPEAGLRKRPGLQGPIDDAFMDSFIFVRPTGKAWHEAVGKWSDSELERAIEHWRRHFRGAARVKNDTEITPDDIASANLILWGDPSSNAVLKQIAEKLPIRWDEKQIDAGAKQHDSSGHALVAIYPNPQNPGRYIVLNSSFTFREYAYLNNARQVAMLPDWAVVDLSTPPNSIWPGKIVDADFFDEAWQLKVSPERAELLRAAGK
ncbi:MAG: hypothetical protein MUF06_11015 [Pirellulaceae bacterium]|nr:hypothetical protein [Pirellulaceae bacterium]